MKKVLKLFVCFVFLFLACFYYADAAVIEFSPGTYLSKDGHKIVINTDNTVLYDDNYSLTLSKKDKGSTLTGKLGTDKKSATFYQLNSSNIVSGAVVKYTHDGVDTYLYDYTVFSINNAPVVLSDSGIELWSNNTLVNSYADFQSAVDAANSGDVIKITKDLNVVSGAYINGKDLTIEGNDKTLNNGIGWLNSIFVVEDNASLTINNLTIDGGSVGFAVNYDVVNVFAKSTSIPIVTGSDSSDIKLNITPIVSKGNLILKDSNISNNYVNGYGGAINIVNGDLKLLNSELIHNRSSRGGAIYIGSNIKANQTDYSAGSIIIRNSTLSSNYSSNGGAIFLYNTKEVELTNAKFISNTCTGGKGGAILINNESSGEYYSMLEKLNLKFTDMDIDNCLFEGNWVGNDGSAIETHEAALNITNTEFKKNVGIHYSSSCGTVSSYMDYPYEVSKQIVVLFDNCLFEENIGAASTIADHGSSIYFNIFNTNFIRNKATYNSLLLYAADTHIKNCTFEDEYVSRAVLDVQSYNQEVAFEGKPATIIFENVNIKGTKNSSTDILIRKREADDINLPWTVIFKGENHANIDLWHKNNVIFEGKNTGSVETDSTILDSNIVIKDGASVENLIINKDKVLVTIILYDTEKVAGYNWEGRKYIYVDEKTYNNKAFYLEHLLSKEGYELKLYEDSAYTIPWDYEVSKDDIDTIGSVNLYGRWEEHTHTFNEEIIAHEIGIYKQCECGYLGDKLSIEIDSKIKENDTNKEAIIINELGIEENMYSVLYKKRNVDGSWSNYNGVPEEVGNYKVVLTYNNLTVEKEYSIVKDSLNVPNTLDNIGGLIVIFVLVLVGIGVIIYILKRLKEK